MGLRVIETARDRIITLVNGCLCILISLEYIFNYNNIIISKRLQPSFGFYSENA